MSKPIPICIYILFVCLTIASCSGSKEKKPGMQNNEPYAVIKLEPRSITLSTDYPATLQGVQTVEIRPRVSGYITKMYIDEGDNVHKGQKLFQLNSDEYQQAVQSAKANVDAAKADVATAKNNVESTKPLVEQDIVSSYELKSAQNTLQSKEAALEQAKAQLATARTNLGYTTIVSPATGVIGVIPYRVGSLVDSSINPPLTTVSDISNVYAYFSVSEDQLLEMAKSNPGKDLREKIQNLPKAYFIMADNTLYPYRGNISLASGLINTSTGSADFRATFPNPERILRSGGSGSVRIPVPEHSVLVVPKKSTHELQDKYFVYLVTDSNKVKNQPINIASISAARLYVVTHGLKSGDRIILGANNLQDGTPIKPELVSSDSVYKSLETDTVQTSDSSQPSFP